MRLGKEIRDVVLYNFKTPCALCGRRENRYGAGTLKVAVDGFGDICISHLRECISCGEISIDLTECIECSSDTKRLPVVMVPTVSIWKQIVQFSNLQRVIGNVYKKLGSISLIIEKERNTAEIKSHVKGIIEELQKLESG